MSKRRGRRSKKRFPVALVVVLVIVLIIAAGVAVFINKRNAPSTQTANLQRYYNLTAHTKTDSEGNSKEYAEAKANEIAIVIDSDILEDRAVLEDGMAYLGYRFIRNNIDSRFYYDQTNDLIMVTNALQTVRAEAGATEYTIDGETQSLSKPISLMIDEKLYISEEFVDTFSSMSSEIFENPGRLYIRTNSKPVKRAEISKDTQIRLAGDKKSDIVAEIPQDSSVTITDEEAAGGWIKVMDDRGFPGYVEEKLLGEVREEEPKSDYDEPEYTHIDFGKPINLLWHGVFYYGQDAEIYDLGANVDGINVISPRWYGLDESEDFVDIYSNAEYINHAHERGWQVWAMISDDGIERETLMSILTNTYNRQTLINAIIEDAKYEQLEGLNVDFEKVNSEFGEDFIQFIRELSIECRKAGIILSCDNYTPYSYNAAFHIDEQSEVCDYVMVMAYDNYVGSEEIGPNSSLDFLKEVMDVTLPQVDESRLVIALPFYSRFWFNRGGSDLQNEVYSMGDAKQFFVDYGEEPTWNETTGMYAAQFDYDGSEIYAWLEDENSIEAKLKFLTDYKIAGVAWWNLGQETSEVWEVISNYYQ